MIFRVYVYTILHSPNPTWNCPTLLFGRVPFWYIMNNSELSPPNHPVVRPWLSIETCGDLVIWAPRSDPFAIKRSCKIPRTKWRCSVFMAKSWENTRKSPISRGVNENFNPARWIFHYHRADYRRVESMWIINVERILPPSKKQPYVPWSTHSIRAMVIPPSLGYNMIYIYIHINFQTWRSPVVITRRSIWLVVLVYPMFRQIKKKEYSWTVDGCEIHS